MDSSFIISHRSLRTVSLAVTLIDDLTGASINGSSARAWIENERAPIKKNGGVFVFTDLTQGEYTICAEGGFYQKRTAVITVEAGKMSALTLRLRPARNYPFQPCTLRVEGVAAPFSTVTAWLGDKQTSLRLLGDAESGSDIIRIYRSAGADVTGGTFRLQAPDGSGELIDIVAPVSADEGAFSLSSPLVGGYPRIGSLILRASRVTADKKGEFFIMLGTSRSSSVITIIADGEKQLTKSYDCTGLESLRAELI